MVKQVFEILVLTMVLALSSCTATRSVQDNTTTENLIIYYSDDGGNSELLRAAKKYGSKILYVYKNINGVAVTVPKNKTVSEAMKYYKKVNGVLSVTKDQKMQLD
jgi:hypothetical protein